MDINRLKPCLSQYISKPLLQVCDNSWHHYAVSVSPQGVQLTLDGEIWQVTFTLYTSLFVLLIWLCWYLLIVLLFIYNYVNGKKTQKMWHMTFVTL